MTTVLHSEVGRGEVASRFTMLPVPLSPDEVGMRIRRAREAKGWSRFDLAIALEVSPSSIQRWEEGKLPSVNRLVKLAEVLEKSPDYLTEPPERQLELADLRSSLGEIQSLLEGAIDQGDRTREAMLESLASIDARLSGIERRSSAQDDVGSSHP
jgi:transcriptional regulator with XRE-family HTH domain